LGFDLGKGVVVHDSDRQFATPPPDGSVLSTSITRKQALASLGVAAAALAVPSTAAARVTSARAHRRPAAASSGGNLNLAAAQGIPQLNPNHATLNWEYTLFPLIWGHLTAWKSDTGETLHPGLATEWSANKSVTVHQFKIRNDAFTAGGTKITNTFIAQSLQVAFDKKTANPQTLFLSVPPEITAVGTDIVQFKLQTGSGSLPEYMAWFPVPPPDIENSRGKIPDTTGPWKVSEFVPDQKVVLVPNERWYCPPPSLSQISILRAQDTTAAVSSLRAGDIDVLWAPPFADLAQLRKDSEYKVVTSIIAPTKYFWDIDVSKPPFSDVNARRGLIHAIDKKTIQKTVYAGYGTLSTSNVPLSKNSSYYNKSLPTVPYDLDAAKEYLAKGGIKSGSKLTFWTVAGQYRDFSQGGEIIQAALAKIGITLKVQQAEVNTWAGKFYPRGHSFPSLIVPNFGLGGLGPRAMETFKPSFWEGNWKGPHASKMQRLLQQADATGNEGRRRTLYKDAQAIFADQWLDPVLMHLDVPMVTHKRVRGAWIDPQGIPHVEDVGLSA
jgi:peptide/nickel transport system substrate-binding protein